MRYLGLDVGERHIGVAVGELLALELTSLHAAKDGSFYREPDVAYAAIKKLIDAEQTDAVVIGLPVGEQGESTKEAESIKQFGDGLGKKLDLTVHYVNETLSSFMAADMLESQGLSINESRQREHQLAAQLVLQQYIEENVGT